MVHIETRFIHN